MTIPCGFADRRDLFLPGRPAKDSIVKLARWHLHHLREEGKRMLNAGGMAITEGCNTRQCALADN
jgi:hypothetical protein